MTLQEIHNELFNDIRNIRSKISNLKKEFGRMVLKASRYPVNSSYDCLTNIKKNLFIVNFIALKRSDWKKPMVSSFGIYNRPEGYYAAALSLDMNVTSIFPPHFFRRYRERIVKDEIMSNTDIIRRYFRNEWGLAAVVVDENFNAVYRCFEKSNNDDKVSFVGATVEGYCFGERQGNINIIKTIISEEMLFDNQKEIFFNLRKDFDDANKERYNRISI